MTPEEMDEVFAQHCAAEAANDVDAILATLADDIEHDVVGDPNGVLHDRGLIAKRYAENMSTLEDSSMKTLHRHHGADKEKERHPHQAALRPQLIPHACPRERYIC